MTSGLEHQEIVAPSPSGNFCGGLNENYECEQGAAAAADVTSLEEKVIDADTMPAFSHVEDADASTPRFKQDNSKKYFLFKKYIYFNVEVKAKGLQMMTMQ